MYLLFRLWLNFQLWMLFIIKMHLTQQMLRKCLSLSLNLQTAINSFVHKLLKLTIWKHNFSIAKFFALQLHVLFKANLFLTNTFKIIDLHHISFSIAFILLLLKLLKCLLWWRISRIRIRHLTFFVQLLQYFFFAIVCIHNSTVIGLRLEFLFTKDNLINITSIL